MLFLIIYHKTFYKIFFLHQNKFTFPLLLLQEIWVVIFQTNISRSRSNNKCQSSIWNPRETSVFGFHLRPQLLLTPHTEVFLIPVLLDAWIDMRGATKASLSKRNYFDLSNGQLAREKLKQLKQKSNAKKK